MPLNDIERGAKVMDQWILEEIMKFRARFIHICYKAILPPNLYDLAKDNKDMSRVRQWAKDEGWAFQQKGESLLLLKEGRVIGEFRPMLMGGQMDPHLEFYANLGGVKLELVRPDEQNPGGILDLITRN